MRSVLRGPLQATSCALNPRIVPSPSGRSCAGGLVVLCCDCGVHVHEARYVLTGTGVLCRSGSSSVCDA